MAARSHSPNYTTLTDAIQGQEVIRPSLQDVAAWLALREDWVFELVNALDPSVLTNLGDPGSLTVEQRGKVLTTYIERYGRGGWRGLSVPEIQVHRLADPALGAIVAREFASVENPEVRQVLLDLINHARLADCAGIARDAVRTPGTQIYERVDALDALIALEDSELHVIARDLRNGPWDQRFVRTAIYRMFPKWMSVEQLLSHLAWLEETKSTSSELSRNLPPLIETLDVAQLEQLLAGLLPLVKQGVRLDTNSHTLDNDRPHLVHLLAAVSARLLEASALPIEAARSAALAAMLARGMRSNDDVPARLNAAIAAANSAIRVAIFKAEVLLLRAVKPDRLRLDLFMSLAWRGTLHLVATDEPWLRKILGNISSAPDLRAAALQAEIIAMVPENVERQAHLESLRLLIADDAELTKALDERLDPHVVSRDERRWAVKNKWRKRQAERRNAKNRASWILFWRELKDDPDRAFSPELADNTARNLWKAMGRGGGRRESGWDRALIEDFLGTDVADRLREALMSVWRRSRPPLASERPEDERNSFPESWVLALTAIAAEAEDPTWAQKLTRDEVETAIRYAPWYINGFPPWLDDLAVRDAAAIERLLGGQLNWSLAHPAGPQSYSIALQNISYAPPRLATLFLPRLRAWLETAGVHPWDNDDLDGGARRLEQITDILLKFGDEADRERLGDLAAAALTRGANGPYAHVLLPVLFAIDPARAVTRFEAICAEIPVSQYSAAVEWLAYLFGRRHRGRGVNLKHARTTSDLLIRLVRLAYHHVELAKDIEHEGSYLPDVRDEAATARNALLGAIIDLGGPEGWQAKHQIASEPEFAHLRDRLHLLAMEKSATESDDMPMSPDEVKKFDRLDEPGPRSAVEMFALMKDRLDDLREHLLSDASPRELWALVRDERVLRRAIAEWLIGAARGAYTIGQEGVTADEKETDIRFRSTVGGLEGVIELKVGDKDYSGADLAATITDQLVAKYLAPSDRRAGILLMTRSTRDSWKDPANGASLDFAMLIAMLGRAADSYRKGFPGEIHLGAAGLGHALINRIPNRAEA